VWLTGLSGAGKSSVAMLVERKLLENNVPAYVLDGDNLRQGLNADLGFSMADRSENLRSLAACGNAARRRRSRLCWYRSSAR